MAGRCRSALVQEDWAVYDFKGTAWALNAGLAWQASGRWPVAAGVKLDNVGTLVQFEHASYEGPLPATATLALVLDGLKQADGRLSMAGEAVKLLSFEESSVPANVVSSWFRHGVRAELHEAIYRLGAEYERAVTLPALGELRLALRGGRRVLPAWELRSWSWGLGLAWRGLSLDASVENQESRDRFRYWTDPWDGTRRLSVGWTR